MSRPRNLLFGAAVAIGCVGSGAAFAADDGYANVFTSVFTAVGAIPPDKAPEIEYRERAPLVLPPKMDLVKPTESGVGRTAAWPQDPDVQRRRREAEEAKVPSFLGSIGDPGRPMTREALMKGRVATGEGGEVSPTASRVSKCGQNGNQRGCMVLSPDELRAMDERYKASGQGESEKKELVAGEEPDRKYLTQPPKGYLRVTRTIQATSEAPVIKLDSSNPKSALSYKPNPDDQ